MLVIRETDSEATESETETNQSAKIKHNTKSNRKKPTQNTKGMLIRYTLFFEFFVIIDKCTNTTAFRLRKRRASNAEMHCFQQPQKSREMNNNSSSSKQGREEEEEKEKQRNQSATTNNLFVDKEEEEEAVDEEENMLFADKISDRD